MATWKHLILLVLKNENCIPAGSALLGQILEEQDSAPGVLWFLTALQGKRGGCSGKQRESHRRNVEQQRPRHRSPALVLRHSGTVCPRGHSLTGTLRSTTGLQEQEPPSALPFPGGNSSSRPGSSLTNGPSGLQCSGCLTSGGLAEAPHPLAAASSAPSPASNTHSAQCLSSDLASANSEVPKPVPGLTSNLPSLVSALITSVPLLGRCLGAEIRQQQEGGPGDLRGCRPHGVCPLAAAQPGSSASYC